MRQRVHNEWFALLAKTTCPCGAKHTQVFSWGEYHSTRYRVIDYFCRACFEVRVIPRLLDHAAPCGCTFSLNARHGHRIPEWIKMPDQQCSVPITSMVSTSSDQLSLAL